MRHIAKAVAAGAGVGALGLGGLAYASTTGSAPSPPKLSSHSHAVARLALLRRAIYAQVIVEGKDHLPHTFVFERGKFTGISGGELNLSRPDGVSASIPISTTTKFVNIPQASLAPGDLVRVVERDGVTIRVFGHVPRVTTAPGPPVG